LRSPLNEHWDVCPAMLTIGLFRLALLFMLEDEYSKGNKQISVRSLC